MRLSTLPWILIAIVSLTSISTLPAAMIFQDDFEDDTAGMIGSTEDLDPMPLAVEGDEQTPSQPGWWVHDGAYLSGSGAEAQVIMDDMDDVGPDSTDNNKLRLTRTGGAATAGRAGLWWGPGIATERLLTIEFQLNKPSGDQKASYFQIEPAGPFLDSTWRATERTLAVFINTDGTITRYNHATNTWDPTGQSVTLDAWNDFKLETDQATQSWSLTINGSSVSGLPFNNDHHDVHQIVFAHGGTGSQSYAIDNISVDVVPEPSTLGLFLSGLILLLIYFRRIL